MLKPAEQPQWGRIVEQLEQSRLTQKQFAQREHLPLSTLWSWIYWRKRQPVSAGPAPVRLLPVESAG